MLPRPVHTTSCTLLEAGSLHLLTFSYDVIIFKMVLMLNLTSLSTWKIHSLEVQAAQGKALLMPQGTVYLPFFVATSTSLFLLDP